MSAENAGIVFAHLADNAARHGAAVLRLAARVEGAHLRVRVEDDGVGIAEQNRARVFKAFFTTRREAGGTGMGLGIVRALLHAHGGTIAVLPAEAGAASELLLPLRAP